MEKKEDMGKRLIDEEQDDFDAIIVGSEYLFTYQCGKNNNKKYIILYKNF